MSEIDPRQFAVVKHLVPGAPIQVGGADFLQVEGVPPAAVSGMDPDNEVEFTLTPKKQLFIRVRKGSKGVFLNGTRVEEGTLIHVADPVQDRIWVGTPEAPIATAPLVRVEIAGKDHPEPPPFLLIIPGLKGQAVTLVRVTFPEAGPEPARVEPHPAGQPGHGPPQARPAAGGPPELGLPRRRWPLGRPRA